MIWSLSLRTDRTVLLRESHQRSWWNRSYSTYRQTPRPFFPNPTNAVGGLFIVSLMVKAPRPAPRIPPAQLVDRSYTAYTETPRLPNPTNAVGGSFILSLHR